MPPCAPRAALYPGPARSWPGIATLADLARLRCMRLPSAALAALTLLAIAPAAQAATTVAPGLVTAPVSGAATRAGVDPAAVRTAALLPDGRVLTAGLDGRGHVVLARLRGDGTPDATFGTRGLASVSVPRNPGSQPSPTALLPLADGRAIVVTTGPPSPGRGPYVAVLTRLLRDGRVDTSFGTKGSVTTTVQLGGAAVQSDGKVVLSGATGSYGKPDPKGPPAIGTHAWTVARFGADGAPDTTFGTGGQAKLGPLTGSDVAVLPDGRIAATGTTGGSGNASLTLLRADGSADPGFHGGQPVTLAGPASGGIVPRSGGVIDVLSSVYGPGAATVQQWRPDGTLDPAFGTGGAVAVTSGEFGTELLAGRAGGLVAYGRNHGVPNWNLMGRVNVTGLRADGSADPALPAGTVLDPAFGGGYGTFRAVIRLPAPTPLVQNGFTTGSLLVRPDGRLLVAGSVGVIQYTGEGEGYQHDQLGVAGYRPDLSPDQKWGGAAKAARLAVRVPAQRIRVIRTSRESRAVRVDLTTSGPGLARIEVRGRGAVLARTTAPVFRGGGSQHALVYLTAAGRRLLTARTHHVRVRVTATFRDLVRRQATATTQGILR